MMEAQKVALNIEEAAAFLGLKTSYLYKLVGQKRIPHYKPLNGRVFFRPAELEAFLFRKRLGGEE